METVLRVFQIFLALGLIGVVLLQRSEGGGLGIGSSGGMGSFMSVRGTANLLTRVTGILGFLFMVTCLALVILTGPRQRPHSIFDQPSPSTPAQIPAGQLPASSPQAPVKAVPPPASAPAAPANQHGVPAPGGQ